MNVNIEQIEGFNCLMQYPEGYKDGEKYPIIIYLHGAGTRGNNIELMKDNPYFKQVIRHKKFPFITVAPQCSENTWFDMFEQLKRLVCTISTKDFTDRTRIYLTGASMGGYGSWQLAMSLPELFAAVVPICGGGMYWNAGRLVNLPVWAFHGAKDDVVYKEESEKMVSAVNKCGGKARITLYPENGHDAWSDTYSNKEVFDWLLENTNKNDITMIDKFRDSDIYG